MKYSVLQVVYKTDSYEWIIDSINSMIEQTIKPSQYIIIINGVVNKKVLNLIESYKKDNSFFEIIILKNSVLIGKALNIGVAKIKYKYCARIDSDDISIPTRCEETLEIFKKHSKVDIVGSCMEEFYGDPQNIVSYKKVSKNHNDILKFSKYRCPFNASSVMFKTNSVKKVDSYNNLRVFEDYDLWTRMLERGMIGYNIQENLVKYRVTDDFYARRGGLRYLNEALAFKKKLFNRKYINIFQYLFVCILHIFVCLVPIKVRKMFYCNLLRRKV